MSSELDIKNAEIAQLNADIAELRLQYIATIGQIADLIPDGYVVAPRKPTERMIDAGVAMALSVTVSGKNGWSDYISGLYEHMIEQMG